MLSFEDFKSLAKNDNLNDYEKVGFGAVHRDKKEKFIFQDIKRKVLRGNEKLIIDIGCGCSKPVKDLITYCEFERE